MLKARERLGAELAVPYIEENQGNEAKREHVPMTERTETAPARNAGARTRPPALHPADLLIALLLIVGFFLGPLKLLGVSWLSYIAADGLAVLIILVVLWERIAGRKPLLAASPLSIPIFLLAGFCVLELFNPEAPFIRSLLGLRSWLLYLCFYFVGFYSLRSVKQVEKLYALLLILGVVTAVYGVYQWQVGPELFASWSDYYGRYARLTWLAQSGEVFRAFSTFVMPGSFGGNMALLMLLAFSIVTSRRFGATVRIALAFAFGVMGVGIAVSGSRGPVALLLLPGAVALGFSPGVWRRFSVAFKAALVAGAAVVGIVFLIGPIVSERFSTIFDPQAFFWKWFGPFSYGISLARMHPFGMGMGFTAGVPQFISNPVIQSLPTENIDSGYGSAAGELGFLGLALFAYFAIKVGIEGLRTWRRLPAGRLRDLLLGPALYAGTYPIVSLVFQPQATLPSSIYFWLLIGMLMKAPALQRQLDEDQLHRSSVHPGE